MTDRTLLIGDIGGTNARFAMANPDRPGFRDAMTLQCADFDSADEAIRRYLEIQSATQPSVICLAAAGPVTHGAVQVTNNHWKLNAADIASEFAIDDVQLINDFEAVAFSIPRLHDDEFVVIGTRERIPFSADNFDVAILGPGTGLGTAGLIRRGQRIMPIVGEGGHIGFAPQSQMQAEILVTLQTRFDRVSVERLVSGPGVENIYWSLLRIHGEPERPLSAQEIFARSSDGGDPRARQATDIFFQTLGQVAGDLALIMGAEDGVYLAGGIAKRYPELLQASEFRDSFDSKGRHQAQMERIPTLLVTYDEPGLMGAAYCALNSRS